MSELRQNLATKEWVIIAAERAKHNKTITHLSQDEIKAIGAVYLNRYTTFRKNPNNPRTKILGGFERGTRIQVNTIVPEDSARMLRDCATC
jgi:hypothetical protein